MTQTSAGMEQSRLALRRRRLLVRISDRSYDVDLLMQVSQLTVTLVRRTSFYLDQTAVIHAADMTFTILTAALLPRPLGGRSQWSTLMVPWP